MRIVEVLKQSNYQMKHINEEQRVNFLMISDDEADVPILAHEFAKNKIANPLYIENNEVEALKVIRHNNNENKIVSNAWIILLEVNFPEKKGFQVLKTIAEDAEFNRIQVFVITSSVEVKTRIEAANFKVTGYIEKPVSFDKLAAAISTLNYKWQLSGGINES